MFPPQKSKTVPSVEKRNFEKEENREEKIKFKYFLTSVRDEVG